MSRSSIDDRVAAPGAWWSETPFVGGAIIVALIAVLGVVSALGIGFRSRGRTAARVAGSATGLAPASRSAREAVRGGGCGLAAGGQVVPRVAPATRWELVGAMAAPTGAGVGPERRVSGFRVCFADSPLGALYAAVNVWAEATVYPSAVVLRRLGARTAVLAGALRDAQGDPSTLDAEARFQVAGFSFLAYSRSSATISLVLSFVRPDGSGALYGFPQTMQWQDGDWRYVIPPGGSVDGSVLAGLTGYVPWSGA